MILATSYIVIIIINIAYCILPIDCKGPRTWGGGVNMQSIGNQS